MRVLSEPNTDQSHWLHLCVQAWFQAKVFRVSWLFISRLILSCFNDKCIQNSHTGSYWTAYFLHSLRWEKWKVTARWFCTWSTCLVNAGQTSVIAPRRREISKSMSEQNTGLRNNQVQTFPPLGCCGGAFKDAVWKPMSSNIRSLSFHGSCIAWHGPIPLQNNWTTSFNILT